MTSPIFADIPASNWLTCALWRACNQMKISQCIPLGLPPLPSRMPTSKPTRLPIASARIPNSNGLHKENIDNDGTKQAAFNAKFPAPFVVGDKKNNAFPTPLAAKVALNKQGLKDTHEVVKASEVAGNERNPGYVLRKKTAGNAGNSYPTSVEDTQPSIHAGRRVYPTKVKLGGEVVDRWAVQSAQNVENSAKGAREVGGDSLHATKDEAIAAAQAEATRAEQDAKDRAERDAEDEKAKAGKDSQVEANRRKSLPQRMADSRLNQKTKLPKEAGLGDGTNREAMDKAIEQGRLITEAKVQDRAAKKKDEATMDRVRNAGYILGLSNENIPLVKEGLEAQARLKANKYEKPEYRVHADGESTSPFHVITKTEHDYAQSLEVEQETNTPSASAEPTQSATGSVAISPLSKTEATVQALKNTPILHAESILHESDTHEQVLRKGREFYSELEESGVESPAFGSLVSFDEKGWKYITDERFAKDQEHGEKKTRSEQEVRLRVSLLPKAKEVIANADFIEETRPEGKDVKRYSLIGRFDDGDAVRVIIEERAADGKKFLSVFDLERVSKQVNRSTLPATAQESKPSVQGKATGDDSVTSGIVAQPAPEGKSEQSAETKPGENGNVTLFSRNSEAPTGLTTTASVRDAITATFPKLTAAIDRMLQRGEQGKRGGLVVIESNTYEAIAKAYSDATGMDYGDALLSIQTSKDGSINGFYDAKSGLQFIVAPNVTAKTAAAVALHEAYHGQESKAINKAAQKLIDAADNKLQSKAIPI